jgi:hypothetical protein
MREERKYPMSEKKLFGLHSSLKQKADVTNVANF